jgi:hypothetical protein
LSGHPAKELALGKRVFQEPLNKLVSHVEAG